MWKAEMEPLPLEANWPAAWRIGQRIEVGIRKAEKSEEKLEGLKLKAEG